MNILCYDKERLETAIKAVLVKFGYKTQEELAEFFGYTRQYFSALKNSDELNKDFLTLLHLAFGVSKRYVEYGEPPVLVNIIEVGKKMDCWVLQRADGANSGSQDQSQGTSLELIVKKQRALADEIESFLKDSRAHSSEQGIEQPKIEDQQSFLSDDTSVTRGKKNNGKGNRR